MAPTENVPQPPSSRKSPINRTGVLTIHGFGIRVRMQSGHIEIEDGLEQSAARSGSPGCATVYAAW